VAKRILFISLLIGILAISIVATTLNSPPFGVSEPERTVTNIERERLVFTSTLQLGSEGAQVIHLQTLLQRMPGLYPNGPITGHFGPATDLALRQFQDQFGLTSTGQTDLDTRRRLNQVVVQLSAQPNPYNQFDFDQRSDPDQEFRDTGIPVTVSPPTIQEVVREPYFSYSWRADANLTGRVSLPTPVPKPVVLLNGEPTITLQTSAAVRLSTLYEIVLVDDEAPWDPFSAGMFLEMIERLPDFRRYDDSKWRVTLTKELIPNDVELISEKHARISKAAFVFSNPALQPSSDGSSDRVFYSNRLFRAILGTFYNDYQLLQEVIQTRYGFKVGLGEPADEFQPFNNGELQYIATVLEDLPSGFRNMPGLDEVVRRRDGLSNPIYPGAPAIAWVTLGYIEFTDKAFSSGSTLYVRQLIAHEMTHFLWHNVLNDETKAQFMNLSGWSTTRTPNGIEPSLTASDYPKGPVVENEITWYRTTDTNFVSAYAAAFNPDEDFAETVSYYIYQPDSVRSIGPLKYSFVKDVVDGYEYVVLVDEKFTFQVFNLEPDFTFPGKIVGVDIKVFRLDGGDNQVIATLYLSPEFGDGAERAYARIFSPIGTYVDQYFSPVNGDKFLLRADFQLTGTAANGYWIPAQITVSDQVGNKRFEGQNQFSWLLFIDSPDEDVDAPMIDVTSIQSEIRDVDNDEIIVITVSITDDNEFGLGGYSTINHLSASQRVEQYAEYNPELKQIVFSFPIRSFHASGEWIVREISVFDSAGNWRIYDLKDKALAFEIETANPDYIPPKLDVSAIRIEAVPKNPDSPDGETDVTIWYAASDDNSGLGVVHYTLLKPNGDTLFDYHYHDNFYSSYFVGAVNEVKLYKIEITLPPGSQPGTWVLNELVLKDKAGNVLSTNFVEIGILRPFEVV